jgi:hypothetical protein
MDQLILNRASASRPSGEWNDDYDVLADGVVVGRIFNAAASPVGTPWMWTLAYGFHEDRTPQLAKLDCQQFILPFCRRQLGNCRDV